MGLHRNLSGDDLHEPKGKYPSPLSLDGDTPEAYRIYKVSTTDNYVLIDTTDSAEKVTLGNTTTNPAIVMPGTGKVGIGTESPTEKVDVSVTGANGGIRVKNDTDNAYLKLDAPTDEAAYIDFSTAESNDWQIGRRPNSNDLTIYDNDGANDYVVTFEQGGNVGIGTTNPSTKLHVDGAVTVNGKISGVTDPTTAQEAATKAYVDLVVTGGGGDADFDSLIVDTDTLVVNTDGAPDRVGINTTAPNKTLEINSSDGNNLRLTYNDSDGGASNYADFALSSSGDLTVTPSGGDMVVSGTLDARMLVNAPADNSTINLGASDMNAVHLIDTSSGAVGVDLTVSSLDVGSGGWITIKDKTGDAGSNNITIDAKASEKIDDSLTYVLNANYGKATLVAQGGHWFAISGSGTPT